MNIDDLTLKQIREIQTLGIQSVTAATTEPWEIGKIYCIRTVTMTDTGRLVQVTPTELVLEDACWIADSGRFAEAIKTGNFSEQEPFPDGKVIIGRGAIIDAVTIPVASRELK